MCNKWCFWIKELVSLPAYWFGSYRFCANIQLFLHKSWNSSKSAEETVKSRHQNVISVYNSMCSKQALTLRRAAHWVFTQKCFQLLWNYQLYNQTRITKKGTKSARVTKKRSSALTWQLWSTGREISNKCSRWLALVRASLTPAFPHRTHHARRSHGYHKLSKLFTTIVV